MQVKKLATMVFFKVLKFACDCFEMDIYFLCLLDFFIAPAHTALLLKCIRKQHFQIRLARRKMVPRNSRGNPVEYKNIS